MEHRHSFTAATTHACERRKAARKGEPFGNQRSFVDKRIDPRKANLERPMINDRDLRALFYRKLREMWAAERKILTALPKMAKAAQSDALRAAFKKHEVETEHQIARLGTIFGMLDKSAREEPSLVVGALVDESVEVMVEFKDSSALDAGLIAGAQAVEHYEIACYGTLKAWAEQLDIRRVVDLLEETLAEERKTDEALTKLAEDMANPRAEKESREPRRTGAAAHGG
jgi:ferritin-like metal-binding protein YciE